MNNRELAVETLCEQGSVVIKCNGNSMKPLIAPQENIHLIKVDPSLLRVGDAVFVRVNGALQVHMVGAIDKERFRIQNRAGHINGWVGANCIYGLCVQVEDRVIINSDEMKKRQSETS